MGAWGLPLVFNKSKRQVVSICNYFIHLTQQKHLFICIAFSGPFLSIWKWRENRAKREKMRLSDSENESRPLGVWINLGISMDDRSSTSPSTVKHFSGCALIVLLTLIVIKGLKTASRLWVTSGAKVATHLFIGDITALSATNAKGHC